MELVPVGYKQTEVGVIPEDWEVKNVNSSFEIHNNLRLPISREIRRNMSGEYPYYGPTSIQDHINEYRVDGVYALIGEDGDHFLKWNQQPMTLLAKGRFNVNNHAHLVFGIYNETEWFYWYFYNRDLTPFLTRQGASRYKLTKATLSKLNLAVPKRDEQRAIATALGDVDALLSSLDRLIAKKEALKQGAMQVLLSGEKRLEGFSGEWEVKEWGEVITGCSSGATPRRNRPEYYKGKINWITSTELKYNVVNETSEHITPLAKKNTNLTLVPAGTFLMAITGLEAAGTRGSCGIVGVPSTTNQSCMAVYTSDKLSTQYLFHYYSFKGDELAFKYCQGTKQQSYTAKIVKRLPIHLPPTLKEQVAIATILSDMDGELDALRARRAKVAAIKKGMMGELLTGRVRLV